MRLPSECVLLPCSLFTCRAGDTVMLMNANVLFLSAFGTVGPLPPLHTVSINNKRRRPATGRCYRWCSSVLDRLPNTCWKAKTVQKSSILGWLPQLSKWCCLCCPHFLSDRDCRGYFLIFNFCLQSDCNHFSTVGWNARCAQIHHSSIAHVDAVFVHPPRWLTPLFDVQRMSPGFFTHNPAGQMLFLSRLFYVKGSYRMALPQPHGHVCLQITTHLPFVD